MRTILVVLLSSLFLIVSGCAGLQFKGNSAAVITSVGASSLGYYIGKNNQDKINQWIEWIDGTKEFVGLTELAPGDSILTYESVLVRGLEYASIDPYLELQFSKLIKLLEFPELQPPDVPFLTKEYIDYIKTIINDFRDGLLASME